MIDMPPYSFDAFAMFLWISLNEATTHRDTNTNKQKINKQRTKQRTNQPNKQTNE